MKVLAILVVILSVAYVSECQKAQEEEVADPVPVLPSPEDNAEDWQDYFKAIRKMATKRGKRVRAEIEELIEEYNLEERFAEAKTRLGDAEDRLEDAAEAGWEKAQEGIAKLNAELEKQGIDVGSYLSDAKDKVSEAIQGWKQWAYNTDWNQWKTWGSDNEE
jgi:uncharacterized protein YjbJ (UPF0337 family)